MNRTTIILSERVATITTDHAITPRMKRSARWLQWNTAQGMSGALVATI